MSFRAARGIFKILHVRKRPFRMTVMGIAHPRTSNARPYSRLRRTGGVSPLGRWREAPEGCRLRLRNKTLPYNIGCGQRPPFAVNPSPLTVK